MSASEKGISKIYKCPCCFNTQTDVIIDRGEDGVYRCVKCGYHDDFDGLMSKYAEFRSRYRLRGVRLTLDDQRKM